MSAEKENITLNVEGMTCSNCALGITRQLQHKGVKDVNVNFSTGEVTFESVANAKLDEIKKAIHELGYTVIETPPEKEKKGLSSIEKKFYFSLFFTIPLLLPMAVNIEFLHHPIVQLLLCLPVLALGLFYFGKSAWGSLKTGIPNMDVLITLGASSAFIYSLIGTINYYGTIHAHQYMFYETAASIISFVLLGNVLEHRSIKKTTSAIRDLTKMQPESAKKIILHQGHEDIQEIHPKNIKVNYLLQVNTGDKIPVDGEIMAGFVTIDESMISGESLPVDKTIQDKVSGGTLVLNGNAKIKAVKVGKDTMLSRIIELVKEAQNNKPNIQKLGDKVSAIFVPAVILISVITFLLSYFAAQLNLQQALMHSIAVLVISCPCAMGLATPTAVMVGVGRAAKNGILIKGGNTMEEFAGINTMVFDKTGTLTTGNFKIKDIQTHGGENEKTVVDLLYNLEKFSSHPIALSLVKELKDKAKPLQITKAMEEKGLGIKANDDSGNEYLAGSFNMVKDFTEDNSHQIYLVKNKMLIATVNMEDEIKPGALETISWLKAAHIKTILLSGDKAKKCEELAVKLNIDIVYSEQLPHQKLEIIDALAKQSPTAMVGDGINDAPALTRATIGISLGNATQTAIHAAKVIILNGNNLHDITRALQISRHTLKTIKQNLFWAFFYNVIAIPVAAIGLLNPMIAALSMAFSDVVVIGNSLRLKTKKIAKPLF